MSEDLLNLKFESDGPAVKIEKWAVARRAVPCLIGLPTSHPNIPDGYPLYTSELFFLDPRLKIARSFSRWYALGDEAEQGYWESRVPDQR
ncbi:hypothetical protein [Rhizobium oryzicola]|uniref:Uncharacterized protein n=1 Tax=Rhizobium oryzicola TaxID=1232668 RepID=A0ABT8T4X7_9HYPH|nr:hypothetical protein [Rhizobium oryzicola]MDO1585631.1 hypothetical protein [Rhizobium oryzicola]